MYNILIVNPPISVQSPKTAIMPLPCLIIGRILRNLQEEGLQITFELVDLDLLLKLGEFEDSVEFYDKAVVYLLEKTPDACLFSTHGMNTPLTVHLCQKLKQKAPETLTVLGGVAATLQAKEIIEHFDEVDIIIKGEAETSLPELVKQAIGDEEFYKVPSAVLKHQDSLIDNSRICLTEGDAFLSPDYSLIDMEVHRKHNEKFPYIFPGFALVESGRGCRYNCRFCAPAKMWGQCVRYRHINSIIEEMLFLKENGFDFSFFTQDNLDVQFMQQLASELISRHVNIPWGGYARINQIDDQTLDLLTESSCKLLFVGMETPNKRTQKYVRKVLDKTQMIECVQKFGSKGIKLICSFIAAFEGETEEEFGNTLDFALECAVSSDLQSIKENIRDKAFEEIPIGTINYSTVHPLAVMPGTDFAEDVKKSLRLVQYTHHHDAYGSTLFGLDEFTRQHWAFAFNAFATHLSDQQVSYYYPILRLFNFLAARPFHLAWILAAKDKSLIHFLSELTIEIGKDTILSTSMHELEGILSSVISRAVGETVDIRAERVSVKG